MLYFSKLRIIFVTLISLIFILIASSNLFKFSNDLLNKKINLGLDLQGGSYLLLEIDNSPVVEQKLQNLTITIKNYFKEKNIRINNLKISNQELSFTVDNQFKQTVLDEFNDDWISGCKHTMRRTFIFKKYLEEGYNIIHSDLPKRFL